MPLALYTIGHSNRTLEEFISILKSHDISHVVDVRTVPKSKIFPWFDGKKLDKTLSNYGFTYTHMSALGGLRKPKKDSNNRGWKHSGFRGYADYMQTQEFSRALNRLNKGLKKVYPERVVIMCAEAVPWFCHRNLLSDSEVVRGVEVIHLMGESSVKIHQLTTFARIDFNNDPPLLYYP